ncbi:trypsin-like serine protease [Streptomyces sp. NPDC004126]|uniref:trypsin-like serine protease n=1 Tax=Streptomyces sp. NPDC004126 TaxID=3390695 RepID=UPI003D063D50
MPETRTRAVRVGGLLAATAALSAGLLPLTPALAVNGPPADSGAYRHTVKLDLGTEDDSRACSGTLVDPRWVLTATSCFANTPGGTVPAGAPALPTTATFGDGTSTKVVEVVPRPDRDLALVRLHTPVTHISPAPLAASPPTASSTLTAAGFGRTKTDWVTDTVHAGAFSLDASTPTTLTITGTEERAICKGDTGGPLHNSGGEVVGVAVRSWQGGCLGSTETRTGAIAARSDGLAAWVSSTRARPVVVPSGQTIPSGETFVSENAKLVMQADGNLVLYHRTGGEGKGAALWASGTHGNAGAFARMQTDGNLVIYKKGTAGNDPGGALWSSGTYGKDGARLELQADANLVVYAKDGGLGIGGHLWHSDTYPRGEKLASNTKLTPGAWLTNGRQVMLLDIEGNISIRENTTSREVWGRTTWNKGAQLHMKADGSLVLAKSDGTALWTAFAGGPGSYATLEGNGSLVGRWSGGGERWASSTLKGEQSGRCLDANGGSDVAVWDCWGGAAQQWDLNPAKELRAGTDKCLTAEPGAPQSSRLKTLPCDGRAEQKWTYDGTTLKSALKPDQCVNVFSQATANGSVVGLWQCGTGANMKWKRP